MSSTFTLKDWTVYELSDATAAPSFDAATNTLTLSPSLTDTAPIVYQFYDNLFDPGAASGQVRNDLRFDLNLNIKNNTEAAYSDVIVDAVTMPPVNVMGDLVHPTLAHFHPSAAATPGSLAQATPYKLPQGTVAATHLPNLNGATRVHLTGDQIEAGETATWTAAKVHHWDGVFSLVVTPVTSSIYYAPYGDVGGRLQGLSATAPADGPQFAYQEVANQHYSGPDLPGTERNDLLVGSDGVSNITGGAGRDTALGRGGADTLSGDADSDFLYGQGGMDTLSGGDGNDIVDGGADADSVNGGLDDDLVLGSGGNDTLQGGFGNDTLDGVFDEDFMAGEQGDDLLIGGYGNDTMFGAEGKDQLTGGFGHDVLYGGIDADTLRGGENDDQLFANKGNDIVYGGFGLDTLRGGADDDTLDGGPDADLLMGDRGLDNLMGGEGADRFIFTFVTDSGAGIARDVIGDFLREAGDKIDLSAIDAQASAGTDNDAFTYIGSADFGGVAGQLRYAGDLVQADVNGDRVADFEVQIAGAPALQSDDFVL